MPNGPLEAVFTTVLWDSQMNIADFGRHIARLNDHASRLRINLPSDIKQRIATQIADYAKDDTEIKLLNITYRKDDQLIIKTRELPELRFCKLHAMTSPLRKWLGAVTGTKHGDWQPYLDAKNLAENNGADLALLIEEYCIVDSDRASIMVVDDDGIIYVSSSNLSVQGITQEVVLEYLANLGMPVNYANLNERLVARSREVLALGTGLGCCLVATIDGQQINDEEAVFFNKIQTYLAQHYSNTDNWTDLCEFLN